MAMFEINLGKKVCSKPLLMYQPATMMFFELVQRILTVRIFYCPEETRYLSES